MNSEEIRNYQVVVEEMQENGIEKQRIDRIREKIREDLIQTFEMYDVEPKSFERTCELIQTAIFEKIIELGDKTDKSVNHHFKNLEEDYSEEGTTKTTSNVIFILGELHAVLPSGDPRKRDITSLSNSILAENYSN